MIVSQTFLRSNQEYLNHGERHSRDHIVLDFIREQHPSLIPTSEITHHRLSLPLYSGVKSLLDHLNNSRTDLLIIGVTEEDRDYVIQNLTELKEFCRVKEIDHIVVGLNRKGEVASSVLFTQDDNYNQSIRLENLAVRQIRYSDSTFAGNYCVISLKHRIKPTIIDDATGEASWNNTITVADHYVSVNGTTKLNRKQTFNSKHIHLQGKVENINADVPAFDFSDTKRTVTEEGFDGLNSFEISIAKVQTKVRTLLHGTPLEQLEWLEQSRSIMNGSLKSFGVKEQITPYADPWDFLALNAAEELFETMKKFVNGPQMATTRNDEELKSKFAAVGGLLARLDEDREALVNVAQDVCKAVANGEPIAKGKVLPIQGVEILLDLQYRTVMFENPLIAKYDKDLNQYSFVGKINLKGLPSTTNRTQGKLDYDVTLRLHVLETDGTLSVGNTSLVDSASDAPIGKVERFIFE